MKDLGLVSIITATFNSGAYIAETIEAIQAQSYSNWELLITDDCSQDNTCEIVSHFAEIDNRIKLLRLDKNSGSGVARNNSIREAKGRFIAFCDSDDRWFPHKLEKQLKFMCENGYNLTYTSYLKCNEENQVIGYVKCPTKIDRKNILIDDEIGCLTAIYDCASIGKFYMPPIRKRQDWCLWIEIISKTGTAYGLQEPLAFYKIRNKSISSNKLVLLKYNFRVYHEFLKFNKIKSFILLYCCFLPHYFYKKLKQKISYINYKKFVKE